MTADLDSYEPKYLIHEYHQTHTNTKAGTWNDLMVNEGDHDNTHTLSLFLSFSSYVSLPFRLSGTNKASVPLGLAGAATHTHTNTHANSYTVTQSRIDTQLHKHTHK